MVITSSPDDDPDDHRGRIERERRKLSERLDEVARLAYGDVPPATFYSVMLGRLMESLTAVAGSAWTRTPQ
jgi:hypothetical protein